MIKLSILIATMPERQKQFYALLDGLNGQLVYIQDVEIISDASLSYNIGIKRNSLLSRATGEYVVFIDDDDLIAPNYVSLILEACNKGTDCIGINGYITTNGKNRRQWFISKEYGKWFTGQDGTYYRTPNHISPVRRELALRAGFPEVKFAEDFAYSMALLPLLKTECLISTPLYHYRYDDTK